MTAVAPSSDPHTLLSRLSLADSTSPSGTTSPIPTTPEANVAHLARIQSRRLAKIAREETSLWQPITVQQAGREIDPESVLKGKTIRLAGDGKGRIVRHAARNVYLADGGAWQVQLEGFHHHTDEEEYQDPLTAASPYALQTSALWDVLFDSHLVSADEASRPVVVKEATYGLRTEDGESAVGLGIKWVRKAEEGKGGKDDGGWAWIWGELEQVDDDDDDDDDEVEAEKREGSEREPAEDGQADKSVQKKRFKGVHLTRLVEDDNVDGTDEGDAVGATEPSEDAVGQNDGDA